MRGLILAAGRGSRLGELTAQRPKALVELLGRPLLSWQLEALKSAGVTSVAIVAGYQVERLQSARCDRVFFNHRWASTNMVRSLLAAEEWLSGHETIVSYADIVYPAATVRSLMRSEGDVAITFDTQWRRLWEIRFAEPETDAESFSVRSDGTVAELGRRPVDLATVQGQYMGLLRFSRKGWESLRTHLASCAEATIDQLQMTTLLDDYVQGGGKVVGVPIAGDWVEVDSEHDLEIYESVARSNGGLPWPAG